MSRVEVNGTVLNTRIDGDEGRPWIVLSNSLGSSLGMWDAQIEALQARYRVLRYDTRGHGQSAVPPGPYALDDLVADAVALMDHFGIETADWMGLSLGAMTGMGLALHHPGRFGRMVLADGRADAPEGFRKMWDDRIARIAEGGTEAIADATLGTWLTEAFRAAHPDEAVRLRQMIVDTPDAGYVACATGLKDLDYLRQLGGIGLPVLYVGGSDDPGAPPAVMQEMADATPGARFVEIAGAAHIANINQPQAFTAAIAGFLEL